MHLIHPRKLFKKKCRYHECKNLKEFNRINRKYFKYFGGIYFDWLVFKIIGEEQLNDSYLAKYADRLAYSNLKAIIDEAKEYLNNTYYNERENLTYTLVGIEITDWDYYWLFKDDNGRYRVSSCVGHIEQIQC